MEYRANRALGLLLCGGLVLSLAACGGKPQEALMDPTVTVETTAVATGDLSADSTYIGTISAEGTASVVAMVSGNVEEVAVSVGDTVSAGDLLCRFDDESARLTLENALAGYSSAQESYRSAQAGYGGADLPVLREQLRLAQKNYEDTQALLDIGAASQLEVDQAYQAYLSAQSGVEAAQASLSAAAAGIQTAQVGVESAQYQLTLYNLTAPISGVVEAVNVTQHNFSSAGQPAFVISNGTNKTVTFYVTDQVRQTLISGQPVSVASGGRSYSGVVTQISGVVDAATGLFQVKAIIDGAQDLPDGLAVELTTAAYRAAGAVLLPSDALYFDDGAAYVYVVREGTAVRTDVTVGLYTNDTIAVTAGLVPGDQVVTTWSATLKDGAPVRLAGEDQDSPDSPDGSGAPSASGAEDGTEGGA